MKKIISNMFLIGAILFLTLLLFSFIDVNLHNNPNSNGYKQYADWNVFTYFIEQGDNMKKRVTEREFICPQCNTKYIAYKSSNKLTAEGHIKDMYCVKCKNVQSFIQLSKYGRIGK